MFDSTALRVHKENGGRSILKNTFEQSELVCGLIGIWLAILRIEVDTIIELRVSEQGVESFAGAIFSEIVILHALALD